MTALTGVSMLTFSSCEILNEEGTRVQVASLWRAQAVLFIFLRHFGCVSCRAHAAQIWHDREKYQKNGAKIVFIGNGTPQYIKYFKEDLQIQDATIFTDPSLASFHAMGFKRGFLVALGPRSIAKGLKMFSKGHKQGSYSKDSGDLWQLGGVLVVRPNGSIAYHYISQATGDFPPEKDILAYRNSE